MTRFPGVSGPEPAREIRRFPVDSGRGSGETLAAFPLSEGVALLDRVDLGAPLGRFRRDCRAVMIGRRPVVLRLRMWGDDA